METTAETKENEKKPEKKDEMRTPASLFRNSDAYKRLPKVT